MTTSTTVSRGKVSDLRNVPRKNVVELRIFPGMEFFSSWVFPTRRILIPRCSISGGTRDDS